MCSVLISHNINIPKCHGFKFIAVESVHVCILNSWIYNNYSPSLYLVSNKIQFSSLPSTPNCFQ